MSPKRLWFVKQNGGDKLYVAVYGEQKGRLLLKTYYEEGAGQILDDLKNKGVPLAAVAKPAVAPPGEATPLGAIPDLLGSKNTPLADEQPTSSSRSRVPVIEPPGTA